MLHQDLTRHIVSAPIELHRYWGRPSVKESTSVALAMSSDNYSIDWSVLSGGVVLRVQITMLLQALWGKRQ